MARILPLRETATPRVPAGLGRAWRGFVELLWRLNGSPPPPEVYAADIELLLRSTSR